MTTPVWPSTTGFALVDGFSDQFPQLADRTDTDAGPVKQRFLGEGRPTVMTVSYLMTSAEREWLRWFWGSAAGAAGGAVWFDWTCPVIAEVVPARFVADKPPSYVAKAPAWVATVTLEAVLPLVEPEAP